MMHEAMDILAEGEAAYVQEVQDAFATAAEAAFLNAAVAKGTISLAASTLFVPQNPAPALDFHVADEWL